MAAEEEACMRDTNHPLDADCPTAPEAWKAPNWQGKKDSGLVD